MKTPWNPSQKATKRVKHPTPTPLTCDTCQSNEIEILNNSKVYGREYGEWPWVYYCNSCKSYVGMHPYTNIPLGTLADRKTRSARSDVKAIFNPLWQKGFITRNEAYSRLSKALNLPTEKCHIGMFDLTTCNEALSFLHSGLLRDYE